MKKICFLCPQMNVGGGLQRVVTNIANALAEEEYEITICCINSSEENFFYETSKKINKETLTLISNRNDEIWRKIFKKIILYFQLPIFSTNLKTNIYFSKKKINIINNYFLENNYDVIIASSGILTMLLCCTENNFKKIGWQHNTYEIYFKTKGKYYYGLEKVAQKLYKKLDNNIVISNSDACKYQYEMNINTKKIYNPLTVNSGEKSTLEKRILFIGRIEWEQKGLEYLIKILIKFYQRVDTQNIKCDIIGDGKDLKKLKKKIEENNLSNYVNILGSKKNVSDYYKKSRVFISTSKWEGFGLVITEAMEFGLPVVAFKNSGPNEIILDNINGFLVNKYDIDTFENKIYNLMIDDELAKQFSREAIKNVSRFNLDLIKSEWINIIEENKK